MLSSETHQYQSLLAAYTRDGDISQVKGVRLERVPQYRRLVYNVIKDILSQAFPIAKKVMGAEPFYNLCYAFFKEHACQNPQVWKMPLEVVNYVKNTNYQSSDFPFLHELLKFEWLEIQVHTQKNVDLPSLFPVHQSEQVLKLNPYHSFITLKNPIHKLHHAQWMENQGNYPILIYRDLTEHKVHFEELSPFGYLLLQQIALKVQSFNDSINSLAVEHQLTLNADSKIQAFEWLKVLNDKGIVFSI